MHMYYGEVACIHCHKLNKALLENTCEPDAFYLAGNDIQGEMNDLSDDIFCEHCFQTFTVSVLCENGKFVGLSNGQLAEIDIEHTFSTASAMGIHWSADFTLHPFPVNHIFYQEEEKWTVRQVYKKEYTERDETIRMTHDFVDTYYYRVAHANGETRWLQVRDEEGENVRLSSENPFLFVGETLLDISDSLFKSEQLFCQEMGMQYDVEAYQHLSGIQLLVIRKDEEERVCVLDLFGDDMDTLVERTEELLYARD